MTQSILCQSISKTALLIGAIGALASQNASAIDLLGSYRAALAKDPTWLTAKAQAAADSQAVPMARAQLLPNLSASGTRFKNYLASNSMNLLGVPTTTNSRYFSENMSLTLKQPLFRPYQVFNYLQANTIVAGSEATLDKSEQELAARVTSAYFNALYAQDQLAFIKSQLVANTAQLDAAKRGFDTGMGTRTDIDEAQARVDLSIAQQLEAEQRVNTTRHQLEVIVNEPIGTLSPVNPEKLQILPLELNNLEDWIQQAENANAELRALKANVEAADYDVSKARSGHYPTVDLVVQRVLSKSDNPLSVNSSYGDSQIGVQVSIPLFSGGYISAQTEQALANAEKARQHLAAVRADIAIKVRNEFQGVSQGALKIKAYEQAEKSSAQLVLSTQKGMQAGTRTRLDILNAQQQLMNARQSLAQARYGYIVSKINLYTLIDGVNEQLLLATNQILKGDQ